jgi:hypothetical protein
MSANMNEIVIHPIYDLEGDWGDHPPFDLKLLPLEICDGVFIEDVSSLFHEKTFSWVGDGLSRNDRETLSSVRYALVRRRQIANDAIAISKAKNSDIEPVEVIMACLRIIRPMREKLGVMRGELLPDGSLNIKQFGHPYNVINVPDVEKLFSFRTQDALLLQQIAPAMIRASKGEYWKFRMAIEFYQAGHFQQLFWKPRVFFRCSAIEAIFSSKAKAKQGSGVVKSRINKFLGANTCIYDAGDIPPFLPQAEEITVGSMLGRIYEVRNCIAHGDKIPDVFFTTILRRGVNDPLNIISVIDEAVSFIVRKSLQRILADDLLAHFKDSDSVDAYFSTT